MTTSIEAIQISPEMQIKVLSDDELEQLHHATQTVLQDTGVRFPSPKALKIFAAAGANVDFNTQIVKIPSDLMMEALGKAPRSIRLGSRGMNPLTSSSTATTPIAGQPEPEPSPWIRTRAKNDRPPKRTPP